MRHNFTAVYKRTGRWYTGWVEELPGASTQGKTLAETKENLKDAVRLIIETNRSLHDGNVRDKKVIREPIVVSR